MGFCTLPRPLCALRRWCSGLIVAGSPGTGPARWAPVLAPALEVTLPSDGPINLQNVAGQDGVTGANLFDAQASGENALLVPGTAILAALSGDSRVHFDYQRWLPVALIAGSPLVVGHVDFRRSLRTLLQNRPVRVAVTTPTGAELPTLLAMAILSMRAIPVRGLATPQTSIEALQQGEVDVVQLSPDNATPELLAALKDKGFVPLFSLTAEEGEAFPTLPPGLPACGDMRRTMRFTQPIRLPLMQHPSKPR